MNTRTIHDALLDFRNAVMHRYGNECRLVHFGSTARGEFDSESDIDVLVVLPCFVDAGIEEEVFNLAFDIELQYGVVFGIIVYSRDFWESGKAMAMPLYRNIVQEGLVL